MVVQLSLQMSLDVHIRKQGYKTMPFYTVCQGVQCKTSSYTNKEVVSTKSNNHIMSLVLSLVHIGQDHVPQPLPSKFSEEFRATITEQRDIQRLSVPEKHEKQFACSVFVANSDIDFQNHTTTVVYHRYCMDCGRMAADKGCFTVLTKDVALYPLLEINSRFLQESLLGDLLRIETWEDEAALDTLHFMIYKESSKIFYANFKFQVTINSNL